MSDRNVLVVVLAALIIFLIVYWLRPYSRSPPSQMGAPRWTQSQYEFYTEEESITLQFTYDFSNSAYDPSEILFYTGLWDCPSGTCPKITGNPLSGKPFSPSPLQSLSFSGDNTDYIYSNTSGVYTYSISQSPTSGYWNPGSYVSYVIAAVKANTSVRSDPSLPADITINPPSGPPPKPVITAPVNGVYYSSATISVPVVWSVSGSYSDPYTFSVFVSDTTVSPVNVFMQENIPSSTLSLAVPVDYSAQYTVTVTSVSRGGQYSSVSDPVTFYVKLPTPYGVTTS
jgi:hypothetical protein